jgi:hypothetical protein
MSKPGRGLLDNWAESSIVQEMGLARLAAYALHVDIWVLLSFSCRGLEVERLVMWPSRVGA